MNYVLGSFYPNKEAAKLEFKEYCFKLAPSLEFSKDEILKYINGDWDNDIDEFNNKNIKLYFDYYIPKYLSCFSNSRINGKLIIGIDDEEEITGIPSKNLNIDKLINYMSDSISNYTKHDDKINITECVNIELFEVDKSYEYLTNEMDSLLKSYYSDLKNYKNKIKIYKEKRKVWQKQIDKYSAKLVVYLNNKELRVEFCEYVESVNEYNKLNNIVKLLKSDKYIEYPEDINIFLTRKKDNKDIFYWLIIFKDFHIERLSKNKKPLKPKFTCNIDPEMILMKLSYLRYNLHKKVKYYIIEITFNCSEINSQVYYKYPNKKKWIKRKRIGKINNCGPGCI